MFFTQFNQAKKRHEISNPESCVTDVQVMSNSARIASSILSGAFLQAHRYGYDYQTDDKIPDEIKVQNFKKMDVVDKLEFTKMINERLEDHLQSFKPPVKPSETLITAPPSDLQTNPEIIIDNSQKEA